MKTLNSKGLEVTTTTRSKREDKRNINIKPRTVRYFQFGLLIGLFAVLLILEANVGFTANSYVAPKEVNLNQEPTYVFTLEEKKPIAKADEPVKKRDNQKRIVTDIFDTTKDDSPLVDTPIKPIDDITEPLSPTITPQVILTPTPLNEPKNVMNVEFVPVFPGCEDLNSNNEKVTCMSSKINAFIGRKFRASDFDYLENGTVQNIYVLFTIDTNGYVTDVKARAQDKKLEKEALRVISQLPMMKAGKQGNIPVNVQYSIPITFQVSN